MADEKEQAVSRMDFNLGSIGSTGLKTTGGKIYEEFLRRLQGNLGVRTYQEMTDNSTTIGAILFTIKALIRQTPWYVEPADKSKEAKQWAEFIEGALGDMAHTPDDFFSEVLTMLSFGWSYFEIVYKLRKGKTEDATTRSSFNDGKWGWRKFSIRAQDTTDSWVFDDDGGIRGMIQVDQFRQSSGSGVFIPIEKSLLFRTETNKNNPEGRALTLDTPIPTPSGWTTMGEIEVGDKVYDEQGKIRYVTAKSDVFKDRPTYEIEFASGQTIKADENHQWQITTFNDRHLEKDPRILTTKDIYDRLITEKSSPSFSCGSNPILDCPDIDFPVDPYLIGYWIGDGIKNKPAFSVSVDDFPSLKEQALESGVDLYHDGNTNARSGKAGGRNLTVALRFFGIYEEKRIPELIFRASFRQRLAFIQGLMDSDGHSPGPDKKDRASIFSNTNLNIVNGFCELVRTIGCNPRTRISTKKGKPGGYINGHWIQSRRDCYSVRFTTDLPIHRLRRKLDNQNRKRSPRLNNHFIKSCRKIENEDTVCIEVDSPSHLFLAGECMTPTHNSILRNSVIAWHYLKRIEEHEAIGIERDLTGLPTMQVPKELLIEPNKHSQILASLEKMLSQIKNDERAYAIIPAEEDADGKTGYKFELKGSPGSKSINTKEAKEYYKTSIMQSVMAQFMQLGVNGTGSFALADSATNLFAVALKSYIDIIDETFNRFAIPRLLTLNEVDQSLWPILKHGDIESQNINELAQFVATLSAAGILSPNTELEQRLLDLANLPAPKDEEQDFAKFLPKATRKKTQRPKQLILPIE